MNYIIHLCLFRSHVRAVVRQERGQGVGNETKLPPRTRLVSNVIQAEIVNDHSSPVILFELPRDVSCNIVIHFSKVLCRASASAIALQFDENFTD